MCSDEHNYLAWTQVRPSVGARAPALRARVTNHKDLLPGLDGRTGAARRFRDLVNSYIADMGGLDRCSKIKLGLLRRLAATRNRDQVAGEMSSDQIAEAQKLAREWKPK